MADASYSDPIQAFLASIGAGTPGNGLPGGGVLARQASTPGAPNMPFQPQINPVELQPNPLGGVAGLLGNLNPYARAMIAAAGVMSPTATAANDTISPEMARQLPMHPASTGMMPATGVPMALPSRPVTPTPTVTGPLAAASPTPPSRPVTPIPAATGPAASSKKRIDPKSVDLGNSRFTTVQYQVPNSTRNAPIYTALNLGGSS